MYEQPPRLLIIHNTAPLVFHPQQLCGDDVLLTAALDVCKQIHHMAGSRQPQQHGLCMRMLRLACEGCGGKMLSFPRRKQSLSLSCAVTQTIQNVSKSRQPSLSAGVGSFTCAAFKVQFDSPVSQDDHIPGSLNPSRIADSRSPGRLGAFPPMFLR